MLKRIDGLRYDFNHSEIATEITWMSADYCLADPTPSNVPEKWQDLNWLEVNTWLIAIDFHLNHKTPIRLHKRSSKDIILREQINVSQFFGNTECLQFLQPRLLRTSNRDQWNNYPERSASRKRRDRANWFAERTLTSSTLWKFIKTLRQPTSEISVVS